MRLLLYSHFFAPSVGGVESIVLSLARGLAELGDANKQPQFDVTLVTQTAAGSFDDRTLPFPVTRQPSLAQLWRLVRESDVVHVAGPALAPIAIARFARKPVIVEHHGFQAICPNGQLLIDPQAIPCPGHFMAGEHGECLRCNAGQGWMASIRLLLLTFARRFLCRMAKANVVPTAWLGTLLQLPQIVHISHGIGAPIPRIEQGRKSTPSVIAFQGRLVTTKGVRLLFESARILREQSRDFQLLIIGEGPQRSALEQFAAEARLRERVKFAGQVPDDELETMLSGADLVVVPSLGGEVFGLVVAENMLRGLPIVASDLGAFTEVLGDTGLVFRTGEAADLAQKIAQVLDDPQLAARLGHDARQRVLKLYSLNRMIESHAKLYREKLLV